MSSNAASRSRRDGGIAVAIVKRDAGFFRDAVISNRLEDFEQAGLFAEPSSVYITHSIDDSISQVSAFSGPTFYATGSFSSISGTISLGDLDQGYMIGINGAQIAADLHFRQQLALYFDSRGVRQRELRSELAKAVSQSANIQSSISSVLTYVEQPSSQSRLLAAIDLLVQVGKRVLMLASEEAFSPIARNENAAYCLAVAAGKILPLFVNLCLLVSPHEVYREAAITLISSLSVEEAAPILRRIATNDQSATIRELASGALAALN